MDEVKVTYTLCKKPNEHVRHFYSDPFKWSQPTPINWGLNSEVQHSIQIGFLFQFETEVELFNSFTICTPLGQIFTDNFVSKSYN